MMLRSTQLLCRAHQCKFVAPLPLCYTFSSRLFSTKDSDKDAEKLKQELKEKLAVEKRYNEKYSHLQEEPGSREHTRSEFKSAAIANFGVFICTCTVGPGLGSICNGIGLLLPFHYLIDLLPPLDLLGLGNPSVNLFIVGFNATTSYFFYFRGMRHAKMQHWLMTHAASYPVLGGTVLGCFKVVEMLQ